MEGMMAGSPYLKLFNPQGEYVACFKHLEDAAALVSIYGDGAEIRDGHNKRNTIWREGSEDFSAGESCDRAADVMLDRMIARAEAARTRHAERYPTA
jgi:hypothetical protein